MKRLAVLLLGYGCWAFGAGLAPLAEEIAKSGLDPEECYRVRDFAFTRGDDLRFYLNDGFLIFGKPVAGRRVSAVFFGDVETGDAELIVMPPTKGERMSLATFTGSPNLNEHFRQALFLFTDDTADALGKLLKERDALKNSERGTLLARDWEGTVANFARSFTVRLVRDLAGKPAPEHGFFYGALQGKKLGNFDLYYDPEAANQVYLGTLKSRENLTYYDTWTNFEARPFRTGARKREAPEFEVGNYRIEAVLEDNLHLRVVTRATVKAGRQNPRLPAFEISQGMKVTAVRVNGEEAEIYSPESLRANLIRNNGSSTFLVQPNTAVEPGRAYEFEFEHEGDVVRDAGRGVYFVGARSNWYPRWGLNFTRFDVTFTYPEALNLVFAGDVKEDKTEGGQRTTRRVTSAPIRMAGFNLGRYESTTLTRGPLNVVVHANKQLEPGLAQRPNVVVVPPAPNPNPRARRPGLDVMQAPMPPPPPNPASRLQVLGEEIAGAFEFLSSFLGPPALPTLMVAPIPGAFGQGFSGLVYLSTLSYLSPNDRPAAARDTKTDVFFSELLHGHETAHQWWGNVVTTTTAQDDWLMEALANYSSLMLLEKKKGVKALDAELDGYRQRLLAKTESGMITDSAGPIRMGPRLVSSLAPEAWHAIVYGKGSWIIHMLRKRMGDEQFQKFLGELCKRYRFQTVTVPQFQELAASYLPKGAPDPKLEGFFETWVEGTGIPGLALETAVKGRAPAVQLTLTLKQTEVDDTVSIPVPVTVEVVKGKTQTYWMTTGGEDAATLTVPLKAPPVKVTLDPEMTVLRR